MQNVLHTSAGISLVLLHVALYWYSSHIALVLFLVISSPLDFQDATFQSIVWLSLRQQLKSVLRQSLLSRLVDLSRASSLFYQLPSSLYPAISP